MTEEELKKATRRPWRLSYVKAHPNDLTIRGANGSTIATSCWPPDAPLILEAVNSFESNLAALEKARELAELIILSLERGSEAGLDTFVADDSDAIIKRARELLAMLPARSESGPKTERLGTEGPLNAQTPE